MSEAAIDQAARERAMAAALTLTRDLLEYAPRFLKIRLKTANEDNVMLAPFALNRAQRHLHEVAERQMRERGFVRIIGLKGRQQGFSTYVSGRGYWRVSRRRGFYAMTMTHLDSSTQALFGMVKRFHENMDSRLKPHAKLDNANELYLDGLDSRFGVATAGSKGVGRAHTIQYFHGSEVAYWRHAAEHAAGILNTVPKGGRGTEVWLESTANGMGNYFHAQWMLAVKGESDFEAVFVPWFWEPGYTSPVRSSLMLTADDEEYQRVHGLSLEQMQWRADKIAEMNDGSGDAEARIAFMRDYPATPDEAFIVSDVESLIRGQWVMRARRTVVSATGHAVWGCDPAGEGKNRYAIVSRKGRKAEIVARWRGMNTVQSAHRVIKLIQDHQPAYFCFDAVGGYGNELYNHLAQADLGQTQVIPVFGGDPADDETLYFNKRSECWGRTAEWLREPPYPQLPDDDELHADLTGPRLVPDTKGRKKLESKDQMRKREIPSPDVGDALAYTFATLAAPRRDTLDPNRAPQW